MASSNRHRTCDDYHVAWICAVADLELLPARLMLDEWHRTPPLYDTRYDDNAYIFGSINGHTVVIATLPQGETGNVNAGRLTALMFKTFRNIQMALLVGIGGGIPGPVVSQDALENIHLGDVVVGWPGDSKPACVYHDRGKSKVDGQFEMVGTMQNPDWRLTSALSLLASDHEMGMTTFNDQLKRLQRHKVENKFAYPGVKQDRLFRAAYHHQGDYALECAACCDQSELVERPRRTKDDQQALVFHCGRIATGNAVVQDAELRDRIGARCDGALCVEMEAAGVDANRRCLVVRGISDYADSHKNDMWRSYAAGNAAAFTRELLCRVAVSAPAAGPAQELAINNCGFTKETPAPRTRNSSEGIVKVPKSGMQWSSAEDERLSQVVQTMGSSNWKHVAQHFHRADWACQKRYEKLVQRRNNV
jgi:nucleoside phosphorylase